MERFTAIKAPWGSVGYVAGAAGLKRVVMTHRSPAQTLALLAEKHPDADADADLLPAFQAQLDNYFSGKKVRLRAKVDLEGLAPFQRQVLQACAQIDYGQTRSYLDLARAIGRPSAARAVGGALARNPIPLVIPCHRVLASNGRLGGFSAEQGVSLKRWLLDLESGREPARPGKRIAACTTCSAE